MDTTFWPDNLKELGTVKDGMLLIARGHKQGGEEQVNEVLTAAQPFIDDCKNAFSAGSTSKALAHYGLKIVRQIAPSSSGDEEFVGVWIPFAALIELTDRCESLEQELQIEQAKAADLALASPIASQAPRFLAAVGHRSPTIEVFGPFLQKDGNVVFIKTLCREDLPKKSFWREWKDAIKPLALNFWKIERMTEDERLPVIGPRMSEPPRTDLDWLNAWRFVTNGQKAKCIDTSFSEECTQFLSSISEELRELFSPIEEEMTRYETPTYRIRTSPTRAR